MSTDRAHTFAWCENGDHDHDHDYCRITYTAINGTTYTCACPRHTEGQAS